MNLFLGKKKIKN